MHEPALLIQPQDACKNRTSLVHVLQDAGVEDPSSDTAHELSDGYLKSLSQFSNLNEAGLLLSQFNMAQVVNVNSDVMSQVFLAPATPDSQLPDPFSKAKANVDRHLGRIRELRRFPPVPISTARIFGARVKLNIYRSFADNGPRPAEKRIPDGDGSLYIEEDVICGPKHSK